MEIFLIFPNMFCNELKQITTYKHYFLRHTPFNDYDMRIAMILGMNFGTLYKMNTAAALLLSIVYIMSHKSIQNEEDMSLFQWCIP